MDQQLIKSLIDAMASSDLSELEFSQDGWTLRLARGTALPGPAPASAHAAAAAVRPTADATTAAEAVASAVPASPAATPRTLAAPLYGVLHLRPSPDEPPFVQAGQTVRAGQTLCVIEAMKVFNEVQATHDAVVQAVLAVSGQEVDAGQPLFQFA
jgi:acetyl-CoA carboxylase biotin carboxyl carrier protein